MYVQFLKETLLKTTDGDEHEIAQFSRIHYLDNAIQLGFIDEFEQTYKEHSPVWWYTHPNFLYKTLNKALQDQHVETLYAFRYFIRQLHEQLGHIPEKCAEQNAITLYRGQTMLNSQFNLLKENEGGLLSISNFLNTTSDIDVAMMFAGHDDDRKAVLIVIHIDLSTRDNISYANIDSISFFNRLEKEWLFSMGSVFRISSIEKNNDDIWFVHLTFINDQDQQLIVLAEHMRQTIQHSIPLCQLGRLMLETDQPERAEQFYRTALEKVTEWKDQVAILHQLGTLYDTQDDLDEALDQFHRSLEIYRKNVSDDDPILTWTYNVIGLIYSKQQKFDLSLEYFNRALRIELIMPQSNEENIARCYNNIASVYADQDKYPDALIYYRHELDIKLKILPSSHSSIAVSYSNVAYMLYCLNRFAEAVAYQQNALDIDLQSLPSEHIQTKQHKNLLTAYQKLTHVRNIRDESKP
ncbi:unnamed protein product [Rotaria sp. Silwood1]|nr:unnamed protein product [Rotaria sp. Silwood1]